VSFSKGTSVGFSVIVADCIKVEAGAVIGHFNLVKGLNNFHMRSESTIGSFNWVSGYALGQGKSFKVERDPSLYMCEHSAITSRHLIDCTDSVTVGEYAIVGGYRSQILTHSINFYESVQKCKAVKIGSYSFVGTSCVLLPGVNVPNRTILSAGSIVDKRSLSNGEAVFSGPEISAVKVIKDAKFFERIKGYVD
tara:strand:+ start:1093 stop:1674 length:582 start_codon:yes stop_codon:yes gene_type:complete